jgi:outer membrane protein, adhesin transport system
MLLARSIRIALLVSVLGPAAHAETLQVAVAQALASHPSAEQAQAALEASKAEKAAQVSGYFPTVNLSASGGRIFSDNSTSRGLSVTRGQGYSGFGQGSATLHQTIFDGLQTPAHVAAAKAGVNSAKMDLLNAQDQLAIRTVQTYIGLIRAREGLKMLKGQQQSVSSYLSRIQEMVGKGASDEAELQQARDVQAILSNYTADYEGQVSSLEADYKELTGHMPETALVWPMLKPDIVPASADAAASVAQSTHPQVRSAAFQAQAAHEVTRAEKGALYPNLSGELSYDKTDQRDLIGGESEDARALVRMSWDLETGGGQISRIRGKKQDEVKAQAYVQELQRGVERTVRKAYAELSNAQEQLENQNTRVDLNTRLLETYKSQFEGAKITLLQLMQSDNQLLITRLERMNAENRVLLARYGILAAMGRLQPSLDVQVAQAAGKK